MVIYMKYCNEEFIIENEYDALMFLKFLTVLSRLSNYAKIEKRRDCLTIYTVDKLELSIAMLKLYTYSNEDILLEKIFKISLIPKFIKYINPKNIKISDKGIRIFALHKQTNKEIIIDLEWLDIEYPSVNTSSISELIPSSLSINIDKESLSKILGIFMLSDVDELRFIYRNGTVYLQGIGLGISISHFPESKQINNLDNNEVSFRIPSMYIRMLNLTFRLLENVNIYIKDNSPLIINGNTILSFPSSFYLVIASRSEKDGGRSITRVVEEELSSADSTDCKPIS